MDLKLLFHSLCFINLLGVLLDLFVVFYFQILSFLIVYLLIVRSQLVIENLMGKIIVIVVKCILFQLLLLYFLKWKDSQRVTRNLG